MTNQIKQYFKNKKILVTGGTGLIGRQLVKKLLDFGARVTVISLDRIKPYKKVKYIYGNLNSFEFCKKVTKNKQIVFHLAGIKGSAKITKTNPADFYVPLLMMNTNLLEATRLNKVKKVLFSSSIGAYETASIFKETKFVFNSIPMDFYPGWAKRAAEIQILSYKKQFKLKNYYIVRPCNVYGPGDNFSLESSMVIPSLIKKILDKSKKKKIEIWGNGDQVRDFAYSEDIAVGILNTVYFGTQNYDFINLGSGRGFKIKKLVKTLKKLEDFDYFFNQKRKKDLIKELWILV